MTSYFRFLSVLLSLLFLTGCSAYQPTKNVWKTTRGLWNTYVSPPAYVDYDDKGDLAPQAIELSKNMMGVDRQLGRLERVMQNADKPPTQQWLNNLFASFSWLSGFAGVKYDGVVLGQQPADSLKDLDFNPLLYEDKKQSSRALRAGVQPSPLGPEIMLATPLYDGVDFLGIVVAYFDMRALMSYASDPQDMVVLCPDALLWPGKFEYAATPLSGVDWHKTVAESTAGMCTNEHGAFFYLVRYLGNLPLIFAVPQKGDFPEGNGDMAQGAQFFPQEREKMPPPPAPERAPRNENAVSGFGAPEEDEYAPLPETVEQQEQAPSGPRGVDGVEIQPGSQDSMLLQQGGGQRRGHVQERRLEGENIEVERVRRPRRAVPPIPLEPLIEETLSEPETPPQPAPMQMPSPFGPREEAEEPEARPAEPVAPMRPSPFGPAPASAPNPAPQVSPPADSGQDETGTRTPAVAPSDDAASGRAGPEAVPGQPQAASPGATTPEAAEDEPAAEQTDSAPARATLPGGRPSPFGPR